MKKITNKAITVLIAVAISIIPIYKPCLAEEPGFENTGKSLVIKSINPGYTIDGVKNVGESIELENVSEDAIDVSGYEIYYTNSSGTEGKEPIILFPDARMSGKTLVLRLASSPDSADSNILYSKELAMSGGIRLVKDNMTVDEVYWNGGKNYPKFSSDKPTILVRNPETMDFYSAPISEYTVELNGELLVDEAEQFEPVQEKKCQGLEFSEVLSYYESDKSEQFIELFNKSDNQINLTGCTIKYKNRTHWLNGIVLSQQYFVYYPYLDNFALTKNPTSPSKIELLDVDESIVDVLSLENGQKRGLSLAKFGYQENGDEQWLITYSPTAGEENSYQKYKTCAEGKVINEETGNCVNITNLDTTVKECPAGKYLNPLTNRCKSYDTDDDEPVECKEGYERNPETNRCRKIKTNTGANYELEGDPEVNNRSFIAGGAVIIIVCAGSFYVIWQFRNEIRKFLKKLLGKVFAKIKHKHDKM